MAINTRKVIVGGVAAGVVVGVIDFVFNGIVIAEQNEAALNALNPDLAGNLEGGSFLAFIVVLNLMWGLLIAWTYALMRPRYGAGSRTAFFAALQVWCVVTLVSMFMAFIGMFPWSLLALGSVVAALEFLIGANIAGYLYAEE